MSSNSESQPVAKSAKAFSRRAWQRFFVLAALWNFSGAGIAFWDLEANARHFYLTPEVAVHPILMLNLRIFWWTVFTFGLGYLWVAWEPEKNHAIVVLAILGKLVVGFLWLQGYFLGWVSEIALLGGAGDVVFATLFLLFLCQSVSAQARP